MNYLLELAKHLARQNIHRTVALSLIHVDMCDGDIAAGLFLSQLVYWHRPNEDGSSKLRVNKDSRYWVAKTEKEWYNETRLSSKQIKRIVTQLVEKELIDKKVFKFNGTPTLHFAINPENYLNLLHHHERLAEAMAESEYGNSKTPEPLEMPIMPKSNIQAEPLEKADCPNVGNGNSQNTTESDSHETAETVANAVLLKSTEPSNRCNHPLFPLVTMESAQREQSITKNTTEITKTDLVRQSVYYPELNTDGQTDNPVDLVEHYAAQVCAEEFSEYDSTTRELVEEVVLNMADMHEARFVMVSGQRKSQATVRSVLARFKKPHLEELLPKITNPSQRVTNHRAYLQAMIYNQALESHSGLTNRAMSDLRGHKGKG